MSGTIRDTLWAPDGGGCIATPVCPSCFGLCFYQTITNDRQEKGNSLNHSGGGKREKEFSLLLKKCNQDTLWQMSKKEHQIFKMVNRKSFSLKLFIYYAKS